MHRNPDPLDKHRTEYWVGHNITCVGSKNW